MQLLLFYSAIIFLKMYLVSHTQQRRHLIVRTLYSTDGASHTFVDYQILYVNYRKTFSTDFDNFYYYNDLKILWFGTLTDKLYTVIIRCISASPMSRHLRAC